MKKNLVIIFIAVFMVLNFSVKAEFIFRDGYTRAAGLGNAFTAMSGDITSIYFNPAGLISLDKFELMSNKVNLYNMSDLSISNIALGIPLNKYTLGISYEDFGFDLYSEKTYILGNAFEVNDNFSIGANIKMYELDIKTVGKTSEFSFDIGINLHFLENTLAFAAVLKDCNKPELSSEVDRSYSFGLKYQLDDFLITADYFKPKYDYDNRIFAGLEFQFNKYICLRTGTQTKPNNISFGFGFEFGTNNIFEIDYTYIHHQIMDGTHMFGLKYKFGKNFMKINDLSYLNKQKSVNINPSFPVLLTSSKINTMNDVYNLFDKTIKKKEFPSKNQLSRLNLPSLKKQVEDCMIFIKKLKKVYRSAEGIKTSYKINGKSSTNQINKFSSDTETVVRTEEKRTSKADPKAKNDNVKISFFEKIGSGKLNLNRPLEDLDDIESLVTKTESGWVDESQSEIKYEEYKVLMDLYENPININSATYSELAQLPNIGRDEIEAIIDYVKKRKLSDISELVDKNVVSEMTYNYIKIFTTAREKDSNKYFTYQSKLRELTDDDKNAYFKNSLEFDNDKYNFFALTERDKGESQLDDLLKRGMKIKDFIKKDLNVLLGNYQIGFGLLHTIGTTKEKKNAGAAIFDLDRKTYEEHNLDGFAINKNNFVIDGLDISLFYSDELFEENTTDNYKINSKIKGGNINYSFDNIMIGISAYEAEYTSPVFKSFDNYVYGGYFAYESENDVTVATEIAKSKFGGMGSLVGVNLDKKVYDISLKFYYNEEDFINYHTKSDYAVRDAKGVSNELNFKIDKFHKIKAKYDSEQTLSSDVHKMETSLKFIGAYNKKVSFIKNTSFLKRLSYSFEYKVQDSDLNDWADTNSRGYTNLLIYIDDNIDEDEVAEEVQDLIDVNSTLNNKTKNYTFTLKFDFIKKWKFYSAFNVKNKDSYSSGEPKEDRDRYQKFSLEKSIKKIKFKTEFKHQTYKDIYASGLSNESIKRSYYNDYKFNFRCKPKFFKKINLIYQYRDYKDTSDNYGKINLDVHFKDLELKNYYKYWIDENKKEYEISLNFEW